MELQKAEKMGKQQAIRVFQLCVTIGVLALLSGCKATSKVPSLIITYEYNTSKDFEPSQAAGLVPYYIHEEKSAVAIDAAKYKDVYAGAVMTFNEEDGDYYLTLVTLGETDGESSYVLLVDGKEVAVFQNESTDIDYSVQQHHVSEIYLRKGQEIEVRFNTHSNDKIPEGAGYAYSRGRWMKLVLSWI